MGIISNSASVVWPTGWRSAAARGFHVTNYGEFLAKHKPVMEVRSKRGRNEGTAWSCAHGVVRWARDCSCHASAPKVESEMARAAPRGLKLCATKLRARLKRRCGGLFRDPWAGA